MTNWWFSDMIKVSLRCQEAVSFWVLGDCFVFDFLIRLMKKAVYAAFICIIALGGAAVGTVVGAMKGQTTETGFLRGSAIGAVAGAITAVQLFESVSEGEPLSKVALFHSLMNGKVFVEWVSPAMLKAYQWQISAMETTYEQMTDIYETSGNRGLPKNCIQKLPQLAFQSPHNCDQCHQLCCSICLQDYKGGDWMRRLPCCGHLFHTECIDKWLSRNGSCPICRIFVCNDTHLF